MSDDTKVRSTRAVWLLSGLTVLSLLLAVLTYFEVMLFAETWRARHNVFLQLKMVMRLLAVVALTLGAAIGPVLVLRRWLARKLSGATAKRTL